MTRDEYIKALRDNQEFNEILGKSSSQDERRAIKAAAEDFMMSFYENVYRHLATAAAAGPESLKKAVEDAGLDVLMRQQPESKDA